MKNRIETLLLVDDDSSSSFLNKVIISDINIAKNIINLNNGLDVINYLNDAKNKTPDAIILDLNMPVMDGWEVLEYIENQDVKAFGKCKIIVLTASLNPDDLERSKDYSCLSGFLNKPLNTDLLVKFLS